MRFLFTFLLAVPCAFGSVPPETVSLIKNFRTDAPKGWSFTQTTTSGDKLLVERLDAGKPEFQRWSLLEINGRAPNEAELRDYREKQSRRTGGGSPPKLGEQIDESSGEVLTDNDDRLVCRFRLRRGDSSDKSAEHLRLTVTLHKPTQTIELFEIENIEAFSPVWGVTIRTMHTVMGYSRPGGGRPSLPQQITTRTRGRALFKSIDADMTVAFTDYQWAGKKP